MDVFVVGFQPLNENVATIGGFDWFFQPDLAAAHLLKQVTETGALDYHSYTIVKLDVPDFVVGDEWPPLKLNSQITNWIDHNLHLIEVGR